MDEPPLSLAEVALVALVGLVSGLLAASHVWQDVRYRRERTSCAARLFETLFAATWFGVAMGVATGVACAVIRLALLHPSVLPLVVLGLYVLMAAHVGWQHFVRYGEIFGALLVGIFWLPLMVVLRRV